MRTENKYQVSLQAQDNYKVIDDQNNEFVAKLTGQLMNDGKRPVVGDEIIGESQTDFVIIKDVLPRKSVLKRQNEGSHQREQIIAANLDYVFITMSVNQDFNLARLDRYTTLVWDSGANPVIVLTKTDLISDEQLADYKAEIEVNAYGIPIVTTNKDELSSLEQFGQYLTPGINVAFIGSSGVGKSTLINRLMNQVVEKTKDIREDDGKGRHTTTTSRMHLLINGARLIDTPGIRTVGIVGVSQSAAEQTFSDIVELAKECKFSDCQHESEPGCAVKRAVATGELSADRLASYQKLQHELQYSGMSGRQIEQAKTERMFKSVGGMKGFKKNVKKIAKK
ncbi:ribosome small subunit-dependent GTPase A [Lentilactobacillus sp. SPB1-3]|uniref:Ribosome small subunit-dependent GTPase A n=1 Tax=Lentilactobacillus terminaliae TaxID=3003483 RepID=A0ACD5DE07_9LACO|nr:ribosome small subunit-dependent GTPase A [Lentilactobacillus sp. SPB1-3]MCZ0977992.1 ribosome small subunit-dependent GTPase A [Lentilactobacillus sp. SPB1-3]